MNEFDLPPFPVPGVGGPQVCESARFYLAIVDELPFEQVSVLSEHVKGCSGCSAEFHRLQQATRLLATLPASTPSTRVDNAIRAFLSSQPPVRSVPTPLHPEKQIRNPAPARAVGKRGSSSRRRAGVLALVAALLMVLVLVGVSLRGLVWPASTQAFQLPANLSWSGYVLHYTQTKKDAHGASYQVEVYQDLGTNQMHIESTMQGEFDVIVVTDQQDMLGEDMMHHIAQEGNGVSDWAVDGSAFNLALLRQALASQHATYLGQATFDGQSIYQIRITSNQVLLLNMQYLPVNVLSSATGSNSGTPIYTTVALMRSAQVSDSMWNMQVPSGFRMGQLPAIS